jgi:hypothetical protein
VKGRGAIRQEVGGVAFLPDDGGPAVDVIADRELDRNARKRVGGVGAADRKEAPRKRIMLSVDSGRASGPGLRRDSTMARTAGDERMRSPTRSFATAWPASAVGITSSIGLARCTMW